MEKVFQYVDVNKDRFIKDLAEAVEIKSVSAWPEVRSEVVKMVKWMQNRLEKCGASVELCEVGEQTLPDGSVDHACVFSACKLSYVSSNLGKFESNFCAVSLCA